jgi:hypothetical protein
MIFSYMSVHSESKSKTGTMIWVFVLLALVTLCIVRVYDRYTHSPAPLSLPPHWLRPLVLSVHASCLWCPLCVCLVLCSWRRSGTRHTLLQWLWLQCQGWCRPRRRQQEALLHTTLLSSPRAQDDDEGEVDFL